MPKTVLLIATLDTKEEEAFFLQACIERNGASALVMDVGMQASPKRPADIDQEEVARRGGTPLKEALRRGGKTEATLTMIRGAEAVTLDLYAQKRFQGVIGIGGGQGTAIACTAMRSLPIGVPRLMVSTIANGRHTFGPYVGTKDLTVMHSVADLQGLNFLTRKILENAAGAICGMVNNIPFPAPFTAAIPVALSMLGTTTAGALRTKRSLERKGFEVVCFHQNGTGGIAMEDLILEGTFRAVLDLNLHEIGDRFFGGLHGAIREDRLENAGKMGIPQVVAPGSINYTVQGPVKELSPEVRKRPYFVHNPNFTLVRLLPEEMREVGRIVALKLNQAKGRTKVFIPLKGFCFPDQEGLPLWDPKGNQVFLESLKTELSGSIPLVELNAHIDDPEFTDRVVEEFIAMVSGKS